MARTGSAARRARPAPREPAGSDAVGFLVATFREAAAKGERVDILMIGPLTNLALALQRDPTILAGVGQLTIMGGTVYGRGNATPAAEFNIFADPEAAAVVFAAEIETVVVPWEPCVTHYMTGAELDALFVTDPRRAAEDVLAGARRTRAPGHRRSWQWRQFPLRRSVRRGRGGRARHRHEVDAWPRSTSRSRRASPAA